MKKIDYHIVEFNLFDKTEVAIYSQELAAHDGWETEVIGNIGSIIRVKFLKEDTQPGN